MKYYYNANNKPLAQELRRNMTPQERHLWYDFLSGYPVRFRRQKQFGRYIVDFYCSAAKIILEIDGSQHYTRTAWSTTGSAQHTLRAWAFKSFAFQTPM